MSQRTINKKFTLIAANFMFSTLIFSVCLSFALFLRNAFLFSLTMLFLYAPVAADLVFGREMLSLASCSLQLLP